jgi:hypothetical protein
LVSIKSINKNTNGGKKNLKIFHFNKLNVIYRPLFLFVALTVNF